MKPNEIWGFYFQFGSFFHRPFYQKALIPLKDPKHCATVLVLNLAIAGS